MKVISTFLDQESWSLFATLQTVVILICMRIGFPINNLKALVFASLIAFMSGELLPRLIYTSFLCMIIWSNFKGMKFVRYTLFTLLGAFVVYFIKRDNKIYKLFYEKKALKYPLMVAIAIWMAYIPYLLYKEVI